MPNAPRQALSSHMPDLPRRDEPPRASRRGVVDLDLDIDIRIRDVDARGTLVVDEAHAAVRDLQQRNVVLRSCRLHELECVLLWVRADREVVRSTVARSYVGWQVADVDAPVPRPCHAVGVRPRSPNQKIGWPTVSASAFSC